MHPQQTQVKHIGNTFSLVSLNNSGGSRHRWALQQKGLPTVSISPSRRVTAAGLAGVAALALLLAGCSGSSSSGSSSTTSSSGAAALPAAKACASGEDSSNTFALGSFLPLSGSLSYLVPPAAAGVGAALSDINAAGGVNGKPACIQSQDSSDGDHKDVGDANIKSLVQSKVSAIVGPESSTVTLNILPVTQAAGIPVFSPAATSDALTGQASFFRDAAPNSAEGDALAKQILSDTPSAKVAILVFNDAYGIDLRNTLDKSLKAGGGTVVYGGTGMNQEFASTETSFGSIVGNALASKPDAVAVIAFDQSEAIWQALASAGYQMKNTYYVDGNLADYSTSKNAASDPDMTGAKGTLQGADPAKVKDKLEAWYKKNQGKSLDGTYSYGAESYDAATILALAAQAAGSNAPSAVASKIRSVTGSDGGDKCTSYADCVKLLKDGKTIHYTGPSGIGPINEGGDPSTAYIGIYQAEKLNLGAKLLTTVQATIG
jgi:neutral amino acid transport system substrate-binding protein